MRRSLLAVLLLPVLARAESGPPMLFQKPRQGRGAMEPRLIGGAVTEFGWRSWRSGLRCEKSLSAGSVGWA